MAGMKVLFGRDTCPDALDAMGAAFARRQEWRLLRLQCNDLDAWALVLQEAANTCTAMQGLQKPQGTIWEQTKRQRCWRQSQYR